MKSPKTKTFYHKEQDIKQSRVRFLVKKIKLKRRISLVWLAFGRASAIFNFKMPLSLKKIMDNAFFLLSFME